MIYMSTWIFNFMAAEAYTLKTISITSAKANIPILRYRLKLNFSLKMMYTSPSWIKAVTDCVIRVAIAAPSAL